MGDDVRLKMITEQITDPRRLTRDLRGKTQIK